MDKKILLITGFVVVLVFVVLFLLINSSGNLTKEQVLNDLDWSTLDVWIYDEYEWYLEAKFSGERGKEATPYLRDITLNRSYDSDTRSKAIFALGVIGDNGFENELMKLYYNQTEDEIIRCRSLIVVNRFRSENANKEIIKELSECGEMGYCAIHALRSYNLRDPRVCFAIQEYLECPNASNRWEAQISLEKCEELGMLGEQNVTTD